MPEVFEHVADVEPTNIYYSESVCLALLTAMGYSEDEAAAHCAKINN